MFSTKLGFAVVGIILNSITGLTKDDKTSYCCNEKPENCHEDHIQLTVTALQVKVFPTTDGPTVTLMCSTACTLTDRPAAYIWYRKSELLYHDWSPWYQEMVTSDKTVSYSCAIKGYEALRAPAVTVELVSSTCFTVSYNDGRMCLYNHTSVEGPCSITYPTEIYVEKTPRKDHVKLSCNTSCPPPTTQWYKNGEMHKDPLQPIPNTSQDNFLCAVSGVKELQSDEVYIKVKISPSTEVTEGDGVKLTCSTSCPLTNNKNYIWYLNDQLLQLPEHQNKHLVLDAVTTQHAGNYSCAVNTQRDVRSPEKTLRVQSSSLKWTLVAAAGVGAALLVFTSLVICCISHGLTKDDKTSYCCNEKPENCHEDHIQLTVTALQVKVFPTTDGQTEMVTSDKTVRYSCAIKGYEALRAPAVTVEWVSSTCFTVSYNDGRMCLYNHTSVKGPCSITYPTAPGCPLTNNKNYIWYLNDQLLQLPEHQNKHLVLDAVTTQHAGNYSCAVNTQRDVRSPEKTLRVQSSSLKWTLAAAAGVGAALLVFTSLVICCIRGKGKLSQNTVLKLEEVNHGPVYEEITDQPTEENGIYYSSIRFPQTDVDPLDSMVQPHQHQQEQHIPYAVVCLRNRCT
ncbi:hypothetical protein D4764_06G0004910 [Takifugu flavidus]|uniref:Ig-like domain-containing protein n=1 Tax=Takifugu flavidus TaxID=433684 RepID=A0A5C6MXZ9_9TELE|nr:hypothetical protein D4764_06G0004910 [Takifugu flavidus]